MTPPPSPQSDSRELFVRRSRIAAPAKEVFAWHARQGALERLTPPWEHVAVIERHGGIEDGGRVVLRMGRGPLSARWVAEHGDYIDGVQFRDVQVEGPFSAWEHTHRVTPDGPDACYLEDQIEYALPLGAVGALGGGSMVRRRLRRMFEYRHRVTADDLAQHSRSGGTTMKILISGASGLIGGALQPMLTTGGHTVMRLERERSGRPGAVHWNPAAGTIDTAALEGIDAVVHLAGENVAGRWTADKKARIYSSRVDGTKLLVDALTGLARPPKHLICASAIGYYGDRDADVVDEDSAPGAGFLADVVREWEAATAPATERGMRVANLRFGVVLSSAGGVLATMLPPFKLGLGGVVGPGTQYMSWVAIDDAIGAILHALTTPSLQGPVNVVAPNPATNQEFTKTLGRVLSRPTVLPMPAFAVRLAFGEMGESLLLGSTRVDPHRLRESNYSFRFPELEGALRHVLGKPV